jgi:hypothetical protein
MAELEISNESELVDYDELLNYTNFQNAMKFASGELKTRLISYETAVKTRIASESVSRVKSIEDAIKFWTDFYKERDTFLAFRDETYRKINNVKTSFSKNTETVSRNKDHIKKLEKQVVGVVMELSEAQLLFDNVGAKISQAENEKSALGLFKLKEKSALSAKIKQFEQERSGAAALLELNKLREENKKLQNDIDMADETEKQLNDELKTKATDFDAFVASSKELLNTLSEEEIKKHRKDIDHILDKLPFLAYVIGWTKTIKYGNFNDNVIEWLVFECDLYTMRTALLVSKDVLVSMPFDTYRHTNSEGKEVYGSWENSSIRNWLNNDFYNSLESKHIIKETKLTNANNPQYGTNAGRDTTDKIFLLDADQAGKCFKKGDLSAEFQGKDVYWWLRTPGEKKGKYAMVYINIDFRGFSEDTKNGIRPAMYIDLDKIK